MNEMIAFHRAYELITLRYGSDQFPTLGRDFQRWLAEKNIAPNPHYQFWDLEGPTHGFALFVHPAHVQDITNWFGSQGIELAEFQLPPGQPPESTPPT